MRTRRKARWFAIGSAITAAMALAVVAPASPASAQVAGRDIVTESTGRSLSSKSITADCDTGQRVIGAAAWMVNAGADVRISAVIPRNDYVFASASVDEDGTIHEWDLYVSAICADPIPGMDIIEETSTLTSDPDNHIEAQCTGGDKLLGSGYSMSTGDGNQVGVEQLAVSSTEAYAYAHEDGNGYAGTWEVTAYAVCAPQPAGYEIVEDNGAEMSDYVRSFTVRCPTDKEVLGVGGWVHGAAGQVLIEDFYHDDDEVRVTAFEDDDGMAGLWHVHSYAICADE
jgi:hypothetical protein